jgi:hypothetical protein
MHVPCIVTCLWLNHNSPESSSAVHYDLPEHLPLGTGCREEGLQAVVQARGACKGGKDGGGWHWRA